MKKRMWFGLAVTVVLLLTGGIVAGIHFYRQTHDPERLMRRAEAQIIKQNSIEAVKICKEVETLFKVHRRFYPELPSFYMRLGRLYFLTGEYQLSEKYYRQAGEMWQIFNSPHLIECYSNLATVYMEENNFVAAREMYLKALTQIKTQNGERLISRLNYGKMYFYLADTCFALREYENAETYYRQALQLFDVNGLEDWQKKCYCRMTTLHYLYKASNSRNHNFTKWQEMIVPDLLIRFY